MWELSNQSMGLMRESFATFKTHALDLAIVASTDPPTENQRAWRVAMKQAEWRKLGALPLAAMYAIVSMLCACIFAAIYYPKKFAPVLMGKAQDKLIEYRVSERISTAAGILQTHAVAAYATASRSSIGVKAAEAASVGITKASGAYRTAVDHPMVSSLVAKGADATSQVRTKVAAELIKLRGDGPAVTDSAPVQAAV